MIVAYSRGAEGPVIDEDAIAFLFNVSPSVNVIAEGGMGASETPKTGAEAFASYILEQFKARVAKSSRKPWDEAEEFFFQMEWYQDDASFIRKLSETVAHPDKLDFNELMKMWLSLPKRERKKARRLIAYKIMEYATEEFLKHASRDMRSHGGLRDLVLEVAQVFVDKKIGVKDLTRELEDLLLSRMQIYEDTMANVMSILAGLDVMEEARKDKLMKMRLRELVEKYLINELAASGSKMEEEEVDFYTGENPYGVPCDEDCEDLDDDYENFDDECECIEDVDYYEDDDEDDDDPSTP